MIKSNNFFEVLRDYVPRMRIEMFLVLEEYNRKRSRFRRGNVTYRRINPPRNARNLVNSVTHINLDEM